MSHSRADLHVLFVEDSEEDALLAGGGLEIRSAPGQGTTVRAWFPAATGTGT